MKCNTGKHFMRKYCFLSKNGKLMGGKNERVNRDYVLLGTRIKSGKKYVNYSISLQVYSYQELPPLDEYLILL
jgi:hypothetical protein